MPKIGRKKLQKSEDLDLDCFTQLGLQILYITFLDHVFIGALLVPVVRMREDIDAIIVKEGRQAVSMPLITYGGNGDKFEVAKYTVVMDNMELGQTEDFVEATKILFALSLTRHMRARQKQH